MLDKRGSIVTLDTPGAEWLNGKGDMLLLRESDVKRELSTFISFNFPICIRIRSGVERVQGTFLSPDECMSIKVKEDVDEELGDAEVNFIEKVAAKLNIEPEKVLQINELVLERKDWLVKSAVVMESA